MSGRVVGTDDRADKADRPSIHEPWGETELGRVGFRSQSKKNMRTIDGKDPEIARIEMWKRLVRGLSGVKSYHNIWIFLFYGNDNMLLLKILLM